ncbi:hypothetical protein [Streptomyces sp. NPDC096105]|uniref:hypothetical protein n=1 Tax=Streptomyces sp. NPDC096105 TaxID=3366074 RepID=UPI0038248212
MDDDDRRPYVAIGCTAESRYERERGPDDDGEARWNYASWPLEDFERPGNVPEDPVGSQEYVEEARRPGAWYDGESDLDRVLDDEDVAARARLPRAHFRDAVIDLARHPRADGVIERVLGRPLPVVVFGMARPGWEVHATEAADPPALVEDFMAWLRAAGEIQPYRPAGPGTPAAVRTAPGGLGERPPLVPGRTQALGRTRAKAAAPGIGGSPPSVRGVAGTISTSGWPARRTRRHRRCRSGPSCSPGPT